MFPLLLPQLLWRNCSYIAFKMCCFCFCTCSRTYSSKPSEEFDGEKRKRKENPPFVSFSWISMLNSRLSLLLLYSEYFISFSWTLHTLYLREFSFVFMEIVSESVFFWSQWEFQAALSVLVVFFPTLFVDWYSGNFPSKSFLPPASWWNKQEKVFHLSFLLCNWVSGG